MSPKELLYIEDVLGHAQFMEKKCRHEAEQVTDADVKQKLECIANKHKEIFNCFYNLLG